MTKYRIKILQMYNLEGFPKFRVIRYISYFANKCLTIVMLSGQDNIGGKKNWTTSVKKICLPMALVLFG